MCWHTRHSVEVGSRDTADSTCASAAAHLPLRVSDWEGTEYVPQVCLHVHVHIYTLYLHVVFSIVLWHEDYAK